MDFPEMFTYSVYGAIVFLLAQVFRNKENLQLIVHVLIITVLVQIGIAIFELFTGLHLPASRLSTREYSTDYASSVYYNRNNFSFFLSSLSPIVFYKLLTEYENVRTRLILLFVTFAGLFIIIWNGSRVATFSYVAGILAVSGGFYLRKMKKQTVQWPRIGLSVYVMSALLYILLPLFSSNPFNRNTQGSLFTRWELMQSGSDNILSSPFRPAGLGAFGSAIPIAGNQLPATAHNWATQLGVEVGLIGLFMFLISMGVLVDRLFSVYYNSVSEWALPVAVSLLIFPINGLGPSNVLAQSSIFWVLVGFGISIVVITNKNKCFELAADRN
ncbi:O-antigen ligase family protein [Halorubrum ezzemoulense]|uniref:O-antigen ligase family protein n=1 Tax=Halorubrum ezzemoulense TaxID=337243 RepID=UPI00232EC813|nr:O-antigen ligase family protein [Halorubrum ezzemoulense]MDB2239563.1 O-antigen ligase family protein [Halorubrum ezzemoulense]